MNLIESVADAGSLEWLVPPGSESVASARARVDGHELVILACDFDFQAGTFGVATGDLVVHTFDRAREAGLAVWGIARSGGARQAEGTRAFVQMIRMGEAVNAHMAAGLPFVVSALHPTTGGVLASWASRGQWVWGAPGATVTFTGPRVVRALGEVIEPVELMEAEGLADRGLIDGVASVDACRDRVARLLALLSAPAPGLVERPAEVHDGPTGWDAVCSARGRAPIRPSVGSLVELSGDRLGGRDEEVCAGLCAIGEPCVTAMVIMHRSGGRVTVGGLRTAMRAMRVADQLGVPVVTVIDTAGAVLSSDEEFSGPAHAVAESIGTMMGVRVPTVAVLAGSGTGGAALAWCAADVVLAVPDAWMTPIAPEASALIVHREAGRAAEMAEVMAPSAIELRGQGIVDLVVDAGSLDAAVSWAVDTADPSMRTARWASVKLGR